VPAPGGGARMMPRAVASATSNFIAWNVLMRSIALPASAACSVPASAVSPVRGAATSGARAELALSGAGWKSVFFRGALEGAVGGGGLLGVGGSGDDVVDAARGKLRRAFGGHICA
jgi:hypothetical protein